MAKKPSSPETKTVETIGDYLQQFSTVVDEWSDQEKGEARPWCRGQSDASWPLKPGELRLAHVNPDEIRSEFQLKALPLLRQIPQSDWEWYFLMQHHGLTTRLLDWTTGSLLGLYFALRERTGVADAAVWLLNPWTLNQVTCGNADLLMTSDSRARQYLPPLYKKAKLPLYPAAIVPPYNSNRITAQRGAFTVHGAQIEGLDVLFPQVVVKVVIPKNAAVRMKRALRLAGIGEFTVFPELDGLCREISAAEIEGC